MTEIMQETMTATKKTYYTAPWTDFIRNPENYREVTDRPELTEQIKADGYVKIPGVVLPSKYNIEGKRVLLDGNSRHHSLEILSQDPDYQGSLDFPFIIMPDEEADNVFKRKAWMLSLGTTNEQLSPNEYAKGVQEIVSLKLEELIQEYREANNGQEPPDSRVKKLRKQAVEFTAKLQGKTVVWIFSILRVTGSNDESIDNAIENGSIDIMIADKILARSNDTNIEPREIIDLAVKSCNERGKTKVTQKDLDRVDNLLEKPQVVKNLVKSGELPFDLIPELEKISQDSKIEIDSLINEAIEFVSIPDDGSKVLSLENLNQAKEFIQASAQSLVDSDSDSDSDDDIDSDIDESDNETKLEPVKKQINPEQVKEARDKLVDFALFLSNLSVQEYPGLSDDFLVSQAVKLSRIQESFVKEQEKSVKKAA